MFNKVQGLKYFDGIITYLANLQNQGVLGNRVDPVNQMVQFHLSAQVHQVCPVHQGSLAGLAIR